MNKEKKLTSYIPSSMTRKMSNPLNIDKVVINPYVVDKISEDCFVENIMDFYKNMSEYDIVKMSEKKVKKGTKVSNARNYNRNISILYMSNI